MSEERVINAWTSQQPGSALEWAPYTANPLQSHEVEVKVKACGLCASDISILQAPFQIPPYQFPLVAGHEGVGEVVAVGEDVRELKVGDRVGMGVFRGSCASCEYCLEGRDNLCSGREMMFGGGARGCFGEYVRISSRYAFLLPDEMAWTDAAPLMCAGLTTFAPFRNHNIKAGDRVAVVGIGGLGHLALQFARAYGCEVTAISSSDSKREQAIALGAHHYINSGAGELAKAGGRFDFVLVTANGSPAWPDTLASLRPDGKVILMGISLEAIQGVSPMALIGGQRSIVGSGAGGSVTCKEMLRFAALHNIRPMTEVFPFEEINEVMTRVKANQVRFRAVLTYEDS